jgi:hypothetical protein
VNTKPHSRHNNLLRTVVSCIGAIVVAVIIGSLLWRTISQESGKPGGPVEGVLVNSPGSTQPVMAFSTTETLGDYLLAAAAGDKATVSRITGSSGAITLEAGTKVLVQGISGPGQARVKILSGMHKDQIEYVNFATISTPLKESR